MEIILGERRCGNRLRISLLICQDNFYCQDGLQLKVLGLIRIWYYARMCNNGVTL